MSVMMADADPILRARPEFVTERPTVPADLDPDQLAKRLKFYDRIAEKVEPGFLLGEWLNPYRTGERVYLTDRSDRFVGLFAPTRSGKGVSFAFPNALSWTHSLFLNDPKKELCAGTAWWRRYGLGQRIFIVEPFATDGRNARFNPLMEIRKGTKFEEIDAAAIATAIVDPDGSGFDGDSGVWKKRARALMTGLILHVLYSDEYREKSLRVVAAILSDKSTDLKTRLTRIRDAVHDPEGKMFWRSPLTGELTRTHPVVANAMQEQIDRPEGEGGSVISEMGSFTQPYRDYPILAENTAVSDFCIADVMDGPAPATVYFVVNPDTLELAKPYIRLFLNLLINRNTGAITFGTDARQISPHRFKLGILADEFTSTLGRLDVFARQLAYVAGYMIKPAIIVQDLDQIIEIYGERQNVTSNLHTLLFSATNNLNSARYISELMGDATYYRREPGSRGERAREVAESVPLLTPSQATRIPRDEMVLKMANSHPLAIKKLTYYADDSAFSEKVRRTDFASDRIRPELQVGFETRRVMQREFQEAQRRAYEESRRLVVTEATSADIEQLRRIQQAPSRAVSDPSLEDVGSVAAPASAAGPKTAYAGERELLDEMKELERAQAIAELEDDE
jgi:type IV secretion system protein VirD4